MQVFIGREIKVPFLEVINSNRLITLRNVRLLLKIKKRIEGKIPSPTKENTWHPNTHAMIDTRDWFFQHVKLEGRRARVLRIIWDSIIIMHDFDIVYRFYIDKAGEKLREVKWIPGELAHSERYWKEENEDKGTQS